MSNCTEVIMVMHLLLLFTVITGAPAPADSASAAADSTNSHRPSVESMLEDAGDDVLGASAFLDEIEYYRMHPEFVAGGQAAEDRPVRTSPLFRSDPFGGTSDPLDGSSIYTTFVPAESFPLQADGDQSLFGGMRLSIRSTIEKDFTDTKGATEQKWDGSPVHSVQRILLTKSPVTAGFLLEHDPGENFSNGFAAGYAAVHGVGILDQCIAGTFAVNAGEGLVLSRASLFSKGTMSITQTKKYGAALVPYLSRDEFHYFRGAAATLHSGIGSLTGFVSHRPLPATVDDAGVATGFYTSGLFRSQTEIDKLNAVTEKSAGLIATVNALPAISVTVSTVAAEYDTPLAVSTPYAFTGTGMRAFGLAWNAALHPLAVFGEIAGHGIRSLNAVLGAIYRATADFSFAVHLRSFSDSYNDPFARAFSERGKVNGECGIYAGIDWSIARSLGLFAYVDHFSITDPLLFTRKGVDYVMRADGTAMKNLSYSVQMKYKTHSLLTAPDASAHDVIDEHRQATLRFQLRYTSSSGLTMTQRCNITRVSYDILQTTERGILLSTDIAKQFREIGLAVRTGIVVFDTDTYDSGLSMYEPDVRGTATTAMLFGQGLRWFIMADQTVSPAVRLSLKYGSLSKWNVATLGSGDDEILGNSDPQLTFQADITL
jgi:hypothetical protein